MNGACNNKKNFGPFPCGPGEGSKFNILNFNKEKSISKIFRLCLFLQIKDMKSIEQDFCSDAWVMPQGGTWGRRVFSKHGHMAYQNDEDDE